jgi:PhoH-like ATPase
MQPLYDNLGVIRGQFAEKSEMNQRLQLMLDEEKLVIEPIVYIRGPYRPAQRRAVRTGGAGKH